MIISLIIILDFHIAVICSKYLSEIQIVRYIYICTLRIFMLYIIAYIFRIFYFRKEMHQRMSCFRKEMAKYCLTMYII